MTLNRIALGCCLLLLCAACRKPPRQFPEDEKDYTKPLAPGEVALRKITDPARLPDFSTAVINRSDLVESIDNSLEYFSKPSAKEYYAAHPYLDITHARAVASLEEFKKLLKQTQSRQELHDAIIANFDVYETKGCDNEGTVLFTGYFTPIYDGSLTKTPEYKYPLYKTPPDLVRDPQTKECIGRKLPDGTVQGGGYYTREEIELQNALEGKDLEIVWLKTRFEAYAITIQGSARIRLRDGGELRIGFAADNGIDYKSPAKAMVADGVMTPEEQSFQWMRDYFDDKPEMADKYLSTLNPRYIFFEKVEGGPYGCLGQPVTAYASIATDKDVYPRGCLALVDVTKLPTAGGGSITEGPYKGFMLDQDRGNAIRAAGRCDIFMGVGDQAEALAGRVKNEGTIYYIFIKDLPVSMASEEAQQR